MVGTKFFDVTIATDDHNEDSVSFEPRQGIIVVNDGSTSASYVEVLYFSGRPPDLKDQNQI